MAVWPVPLIRTTIAFLALAASLPAADKTASALAAAERKAAAQEKLVQDLRTQLDAARTATTDRVDRAKAGLEGLNRELAAQLAAARTATAAAQSDVEGRDALLRVYEGQAGDNEAARAERVRIAQNLAKLAAKPGGASQQQAAAILQMQEDLHAAVNWNAGEAQRSARELARMAAEAKVKAESDERANAASRFAIYGSWGTGIISLLGLYIVNRRHISNGAKIDIATVKLDEATATAKDAFAVANRVNEKIASVGLRLAKEPPARVGYYGAGG